MSTKLEEARAYAAQAHAAFTYGDGVPYTVHLAGVEQVLRRFGVTEAAEPELLIAAWLHDVVEDTGRSVDEVRERFGARVAELVWAVTNEPGPNRKERHLKTYPKTLATPGAVRLKLADRISNVEASLKARKDLLSMYRREYPGFRQALHRPGEADPMWAHLDDLFSRG